ncbi:MAG: DnaD domain protein, partial [Chloroflexi bacterium]|nr:DnaD domain protein [Chloroflexota bacterium]
SRPNIFSLYEENIGIMGHIMAEELKEAEKSYPQEWIEEAFREAVVQNKRSWRYIEAILKGWMTEGREHGEPGRHSKKVDAREWIRRHGLPRPSR